jgi:hypothetical protein
MLASLDDVRAAIRAELPALLKVAIAEAMHRRDEPPFVSPRRAVELSGLSLATVRRRIKDGTLESKKVGGRVLVSTASLNPIDEVAVARAAMKAAGG